MQFKGELQRNVGFSVNIVKSVIKKKPTIVRNNKGYSNINRNAKNDVGNSKQHRLKANEYTAKAATTISTATTKRKPTI